MYCCIESIGSKKNLIIWIGFPSLSIEFLLLHGEWGVEGRTRPAEERQCSEGVFRRSCRQRKEAGLRRRPRTGWLQTHDCEVKVPAHHSRRRPGKLNCYDIYASVNDRTWLKDPSPKCWETIAIGAIPILVHGPLDDSYSQFPIAFINSSTSFLRGGKQSMELLEKVSSHLYNFILVVVDILTMIR